MDITLLSKMVNEIILDKDEVTLPGVGTFVAEVVPSSFSDRGYTINPPYRKLSFRQKESSDSSLVEFYAKSNNLDMDAATSIVVRFLAEMRSTLEQKKTVVFPELGRLRATRENNFFFIPDENLNIYPDGFGLEAVSLKTHVETEDEVVAAMESLQSMIDPVITEPKVEPVKAEPAAEPTPVADALAAEIPAVQSPLISSETSTSEPAVESTAESTSVAPMTEVPSEPIPAATAEPEPEVSSESTPAAPAVPEVKDSVAAAEPAVPAAVMPLKETAPETKDPAPEAKKYIPETKRAVKPAKESKPMPKAVKVLLVCLAVAAVLLIALAVLGRVAPDIVDKILYSKEELEILNHFK